MNAPPVNIIVMRMRSASTRPGRIIVHVEMDILEMEVVVCLFVNRTVSMVESACHPIRVNAEVATKAPHVKKI